MTAYDVALRPRPDPGRPRARPPPRVRGHPRRPAAASTRRRTPDAAPVHAHGADASRTRSGWRPASTRTPSASTRWPRSASGTSRSAPSPASRSRATRGRGCSGCPPTGRSSTGWASTTTAPRRWPRRLAQRRAAGVAAGRRARRQHRQDQGRARGRRGRGARRLHQVGPPARAARRLPGRQRQLAEHPGPAQPPGRRPAGAAAGRRTPGGRRRADRTCRCWSRSPRTWPTTTSPPSPTWPCAVGSTASSPPTPPISRDGLRTPAAEVEAVGAGGLSGAPLAERSLEVLRCCTDGRRRRPHPDLGRRDHHRRTTPAPGSRPVPPSCRPTPASSTAGRGWPRRIARRPRPRRESLHDHLRSPRSHARRRASPRPALRRHRPARRRCCTSGASTTPSPGSSGSRSPPPRRWPPSARW